MKKYTLLINIVALFALLAGQGASAALTINPTVDCPPISDGPLKVSIQLGIIKIYNINTVDETYQIDGYLTYSWKDKRIVYPGNYLAPLIFENEKARYVLNNQIWSPNLEFINIRKTNETNNLKVKIFPDSKVIVVERFFGTFDSTMNFKRFPFDTQIFTVDVEFLSHKIKDMVFSKTELFPSIGRSHSVIESWEIEHMGAEVTKKEYESTSSSYIDDSTYSRAIFEVKVKRMSGYYVWQVLLPLFIIIMSSFTIFWIDSYSTQLNVAFTSMLTVVAFNFFSSSMLPKLPYNTLIEYIIIIGYVIISFSIIALIISERCRGLIDNKRLIKIFRYAFPSSFILSVSLVYILI